MLDPEELEREVALYRRARLQSRWGPFFFFVLAAAFAVLSALLWVAVRVRPAATSEVWIDDVSVTVVDVRWVDYLPWYCVVAAVVALVAGTVASCWESSSSPPQTHVYRPRRRRGGNSHDDRDREEQPRSSLRPLPPGADGETADGPGMGSAAAAAAAAAMVGGRYSGRLSAHAVRTEDALRRLLRHQPSAPAAAAPPLSLQHSPAASPRGTFLFGLGGSGVVSVDYEVPSLGGGRSAGARGGGGGGGSGGGEGIDWAALGVRYPDRGLTRLREWISLQCRELMRNVDEVDAWMAARGAAEFDCSHSLQELTDAPPQQQQQQQSLLLSSSSGGMMSMGLGGGLGGAGGSSRPSGGFGLGAGVGFGGLRPQQQQQQQQPQQQQRVTKGTALAMERDRQRQQQGAGDVSTGFVIDKRVSLENQLEPTPGAFTAAELASRRSYVLQRLRTFARQRTLSSFHHARGDAATWHEGLPCDSLLLLTVLRCGVEGFHAFVVPGPALFSVGSGGGMQADAAVAHSLLNPLSTTSSSGVGVPPVALVAGDAGEPYFYVRHRSAGGAPVLFTPAPGHQCFFEALLVLVAVVERSYGGVCGKLDKLSLAKVGLDAVLREGS